MVIYMKKLIPILIFALLILSSCSFLDGDAATPPKDDTATSDPVTPPSQEEPTTPPDWDPTNPPDAGSTPADPSTPPEEDPTNPPADDPTTDPTIPPSDEQTEPPSDTEEEGSGEVSKPAVKVDVLDYIVGLVGSEYASDADFLNFVATMDQRAVGKIIYASPNGDGEGTIDDPAPIEDAIDMAKAGDTVYLRGGEYIFTEAIWLEKGGSAGAYITIKSHPGEWAVLTTTPENVNKYDENGEYLFFGFDAGCSYMIFEDLEICGATDKYVAAFACYDGGQNHLIFKNIDIHDLKTTKTGSDYGCNAFLFMGEKKNPINNIMLINNYCHDLTLGYSEAVSFAGNCEYCYVIDNWVFDCTNIGIDFYGNAGYCSTEALDQARYCVAAFNTVYNCNSPYADCAGIYVDGGRNCLIEGNLVYNCQYGIEIGSEELNDNYPVTDIVVRNNILKGNTVCTIRIGGYDTKSSGTVKNSFFYNNTFVDNTGDSDIIISKVDGIVFANNIFISNIPYIETEFSAQYIKNLSFYNNCFNKGEENISIYDTELTVDELNNVYGGENFVYNITLDADYAPLEEFAGCEDYAPLYDFHLAVREKHCIGAVEK